MNVRMNEVAYTWILETIRCMHSNNFRQCIRDSRVLLRYHHYTRYKKMAGVHVLRVLQGDCAPRYYHYNRYRERERGRERERFSINQNNRVSYDKLKMSNHSIIIRLPYYMKPFNITYMSDQFMK